MIKEEIVKYQKKYRGEKITCECGCIITKCNIKPHLKTPKHTKFMALQVLQQQQVQVRDE